MTKRATQLNDGGLGGFLLRWLRGQLLVSLAIALLTAAGLALFDLPAPIALGAITGVGWMIPWLGGIVAYLIALIVVMIVTPGWVEILTVTGVYVVVSLLESLLLTPWIMGRSVGVSPLLIFLALLAGGALFGWLGLLLAVPAAAAATYFWRRGAMVGTTDTGQTGTRADHDS